MLVGQSIWQLICVITQAAHVHYHLVSSYRQICSKIPLKVNLIPLRTAGSFTLLRQTLPCTLQAPPRHRAAITRNGKWLTRN